MTERLGAPGERLSRSYSLCAKGLVSSPIEVISAENPQVQPHSGGAFAYPGFRWFFVGLVLLSLGFWIGDITQRWLAQELTGSPLSVGFIGFMASLPILLFSLPGGVLADRVDRVKLIAVSRSFAALLALILALLAWLELVQLWHVALGAFVLGTVVALELPGRQALFPNLINKDDLMHAVAIYSGVWSSSTILGPAVAGLLITRIGVAGCFLATAGFYLAAVAAFLQVNRYVDHRPEDFSQEAPWGALLGGLQYIRTSPILLGLLGFALLLGLFGGTIYQALLPSFAADVLHGDASTFGLLLTASGIGSLGANVLLALKADLQSKGLLVVAASLGFGVTLVLLSLSSTTPFAMVAMALSGTLNAAFMTLATTLIQANVTDEMRGRVMSVYMLTWGVTAFGSLFMGFLGSTLGVPMAIAVGGTLVIISAAGLLAKVPEVARLQ